MLKRTGNIFTNNLLLWFALVALGLSFSWGPLFFSKSDQKAESERIYRVFEAKEKLIRAEIDLLSAQLSSGEKVKELWLNTNFDDQGNPGLYYTVSVHDSMVYWSSSLVAFNNKIEPVKPEGSLKRMPTGWFYVFSRQAEAYTITGYMLIKRDFPYQNKYVQSAFQSDFHLSDQCEVVPATKPGTIQVFCREGKFHIGIQFKDKQNGSSREAIPASLIFLLFIVLLLSILTVGLPLKS